MRCIDRRICGPFEYLCHFYVGISDGAAIARNRLFCSDDWRMVSILVAACCRYCAIMKMGMAILWGGGFNCFSMNVPASRGDEVMVTSVVFQRGSHITTI